MVAQGEASQVVLVAINLLTFIKGAQHLGIADGTEFGTNAVGLEKVVVVRDVTQKTQRQLAREIPFQQELRVKETGLVVARCLHGFQQVGV